MKTLMRLILYLTAVIFVPSLSHAKNLDKQINKACLRHAVSLITRLQSEVIGELEQNQSDKALKLATESCQAYFKKEFNPNAEAISLSQKQSTEDSDDKGVTDWLTEKILNDDSSRKKGNKRLMKKR